MMHKPIGGHLTTAYNATNNGDTLANGLMYRRGECELGSNHWSVYGTLDGVKSRVHSVAVRREWKSIM